MLTAGVKRTLYLLWGGAFLVLLIGGLNIANLALARLALRRKELATRIALGAGRAQLMRQLIVENLGLALVGGMGGIALGAVLLRTLNVIGLEHFPRPGEVTDSIALPRSRYPKPELLRDFMNRALPAVRAIPGVSIAGATDAIPLGSNHDDSVILAEGYQMKPGESLISPLNISVMPGYFEALGIHMVRGRSFDERDNENAPRVVIVDERLAQHFWPDRDPLGRRMDMPGDDKDLLKIDEHTGWLTVVGVARNLRYENLDGSAAPAAAYYFPNSQQPPGSFTCAPQTPS